MHRTILASSAALLCVGYANAQPIPITNFSFEDPVFGPGGFNGNGPVPGWAAVANIGQSWGVFYPTVATWGYITSLGHQLLYTNGPTIEHVTSAQSQASTTYTLQVDVVNRPNFGANSYFIELYAGATLIARDDNSLHPPVGGYLVSTITYTFPSSGPLIGQTLRIRLGGLNQTNFDNVRLFIGTPTCYANCDGSTTSPVLNVNDFVCFNNRFAAGNPYANCDGSTTTPVLNVNDFVCFNNRFAAGCP